MVQQGWKRAISIDPKVDIHLFPTRALPSPLWHCCQMPAKTHTWYFPLRFARQTDEITPVQKKIDPQKWRQNTRKTEDDIAETWHMKRSLGKCFTSTPYVTIEGKLDWDEIFSDFSEFFFSTCSISTTYKKVISGYDQQPASFMGQDSFCQVVQ